MASAADIAQANQRFEAISQRLQKLETFVESIKITGQTGDRNLAGAVLDMEIYVNALKSEICTIWREDNQKYTSAGKNQRRGTLKDNLESFPSLAFGRIETEFCD